MALFAAGAVLALAGVIWQRNVLVNSAIVILLAAVLLGLWGRRSRGRDHESKDA